ncbi:MAG TPA: hypothetical protein VK452_04490 [Dissulfurispiraceae bacterium]|nr:hypothetical protein [Dissulfurispiraceae bacterium]
MYIFRGGQIVDAGIYWESENNEKVVMRASGYLPGLDNKVYFKIPDFYLMIPILFCGLVFSVMFPYGIGLLIFACICMVHNILFSVCSACEDFLKEIFAHMSVAYKPNLSFFSGSSKKLKKRKRTTPKSISAPNGGNSRHQ